MVAIRHYIFCFLDNEVGLERHFPYVIDNILYNYKSTSYDDKIKINGQDVISEEDYYSFYIFTWSSIELIM